MFSVLFSRTHKLKLLDFKSSHLFSICFYFYSVYPAVSSAYTFLNSLAYYLPPNGKQMYIHEVHTCGKNTWQVLLLAVIVALV